MLQLQLLFPRCQHVDLLVIDVSNSWRKLEKAVTDALLALVRGPPREGCQTYGPVEATNRTPGMLRQTTLHLAIRKKMKKHSSSSSLFTARLSSSPTPKAHCRSSTCHGDARFSLFSLLRYKASKRRSRTAGAHMPASTHAASSGSPWTEAQARLRESPPPNSQKTVRAERAA